MSRPTAACHARATPATAAAMSARLLAALLPTTGGPALAAEPDRSGRPARRLTRRFPPDP